MDNSDSGVGAAHQRTVDLRPVSIDIKLDGVVETFDDVEVTDDEAARLGGGELPERVRLILEARRLDAMWGEIHERNRKLREKWAAGLTRAKVRELERKAKDPDADLTQDELEQWLVAVQLSEPSTNREREWTIWYHVPVAASLFDLRAPRGSHIARRPPRRPRGSRSRSTARRQRGSPARLDDPHLARRGKGRH